MDQEDSRPSLNREEREGRLTAFQYSHPKPAVFHTVDSYSPQCCCLKYVMGQTVILEDCSWMSDLD